MRVTRFREAMLSQPSALGALEASLASAPWPEGVARWRPGDTVALLAMGAAHHSTSALATVLRAGGIRAIDLVASEAGASGAAALGDHALVVTESGRSPEPIAAARAFPRGRRLVVTNDPGAPVAGVADATIDLGGFADSQIYTVGFTAMLTAYEHLRRLLSIESFSPSCTMADAVGSALEAFAEPAARHAAMLANASYVDVVGSGLSHAAACEIALLIREGLRIPAAAHETGQYLHGRMESVGRGTVVVVIGDGRERAIPESLAGIGVDVIVIGGPLGGTLGADIPAFDVGHHRGLARVAAEAVAGQRLIASAAEELPFELEEFLHSQSDTKV